MICKINAGAVAGLQSLDYYYESSVLDYVKQQLFMELYDYLDANLTADKKHCLNWGPICLEHLLCKYLRFITDPLFYAYFASTFYTLQLFGAIN